jgi:uncharacterized membrane protein
MRWLLPLGVALILVGFALVFMGSLGESNASAGGVIFIGPFPIVFGSGPGGGELALISLLIGGVTIALMLLWGWREARLAS